MNEIEAANGVYDGYKQLACAILLRSFADYVGLRNLEKEEPYHPKISERRRKEIKRIDRFLRGKYAGMMLDAVSLRLSPDAILNRLNRMDKLDYGVKP